MAGVNVDSGGKGGRKSVDSDINMIPMIDLLMVTISFLLITAVWTHMARINADAQVPGQADPTKEITPTPEEKMLHIEMRDPSKFTLMWKQGSVVVNSFDVPRHDDVQGQGKAKIVRYPDLAAKIQSEWQSSGQHREGSDPKLDQAILHTDNDTAYLYVIGVIDAIYQAHRPMTVAGKTDQVPAFNVVFSVN